MKFHPKLADVNAIQWTGDNADEIQSFVEHSAVALKAVCDVGGGYLAVGAGVLRLRDWLVRGVDQQLIYLRSDIFDMMFEPATEPPAHRLDPNGDVSMPPVFAHCSTCGHWCNKCGACRECALSVPGRGASIGDTMARMFKRTLAGRQKS